MRYLALATDYDNTLATHAEVRPELIEALRKLRESGRKLILVTGRELPDLLSIFPEIDLFDRVVAENGALMYRPGDRSEQVLAEPAPAELIESLRARDVPLSAGHTIVATVQPHETQVLECIRELGLEMQVIFNREAVMVLPSGTNKASGLLAALEELHISPHNVVATGDGENDHAFIDVCECAVAVANAVPSLQERADFVTTGIAGDGVLQIVQALLRDDFAVASAKLTRHHLSLGTTDKGHKVLLPAYGENVLVAGTSGGGKSTLATGFFEQISRRGYQFCVIDPEGDYDNFEDGMTLGSPKQPPAISEIMQLLEEPDENAIVNMLGIKLDDRPTFFQTLFTAIAEMRARVGRPHWLLIDEAHHLMPDTWAPVGEVLPEQMQGMFMITVHPDRLSRALVHTVSTMVAIGKGATHTLRSFAHVAGASVPKDLRDMDLPAGEGLAWRRAAGNSVVHFIYEQPTAERKRHQRKYAEGDLGPDRSFYFRGPDNRLRLRAQNLSIFMQLAEGVDDETWLHHLRRGDYSRWFAEYIKDSELAAAVEPIERDASLSAEESRAGIRAQIEQRYTEPA